MKTINWEKGVFAVKSETIFQMKSISDAIPASSDLHLHMCGTTYPNRNYLINRPRSHVACIEYIVSGKGHVQVGDQSFVAQAGDTYFLPQGADHHYFSDKKDPWEKIWINLSGEFLRNLSALYGIEGKLHFPGLDISDLLNKLQYYAAHPEQRDAAEKCSALILEIFFRMADITFSDSQKKLSPVEKMLRYIEQHETEPIRLEQLADVCEKSPSQAERIFHKEMGMPIYRYVLGRKIDLAKRLLTETGMPVRDIAAYLSFDDEFYFSGLFSRKVGVSPTQYRKTNGKETPPPLRRPTPRRQEEDIVLL